MNGIDFASRLDIIFTNKSSAQEAAFNLNAVFNEQSEFYQQQTVRIKLQSTNKTSCDLMQHSGVIAERIGHKTLDLGLYNLKIN